MAGALFGSQIGPAITLRQCVNNGGLVSYVMAANAAGWAARFVANSTKDIKSVIINWSSVSSPSTVTLTIETLDANGKPTGTLYDANATKTFTPVAGNQTVTFDVLPTTGLVAGTGYAVVMVTQSAGTTQTLSSSINSGLVSNYPAVVLTTSTAGTRSSFVEVSSSTPNLGFIMEDDVYERSLFATVSNTSATNKVYSTNIAACKFIIKKTILINGVFFIPTYTGTPTGDLNISIRDTSNNTITGTSVDFTEVHINSANMKNIYAKFQSIVTLPPGTYYFVLYSSGSTSSNCYGLRSFQLLNSNFAASNFLLASNTVNTTVGITDSTMYQAPVWLSVDDILATDPVSSPILGGLVR